MHHCTRIAAALVLTVCSSAATALTDSALRLDARGDEAKKVASIVDPIITAELASSGIPGATFVFVRGGRIVYERGYGVSDVQAARAVDPKRDVWPAASITKVITALAALQLVDRGRVDLDADVNRYLKRLQVPSQGYGPLTLRHLLSHTAGLDELPGRRFDGTSRPDMAAFLKDKLVRYRAPSRLTAYSSYGMALVGVLIEDVSGQSYRDYVREHIFRPAGMKAWIMTARGDERGVVTPYEVVKGKAAAVAHEWYVTTPTSSMVATTSDMARLLSVLLQKGRGKGGARLLSPALTAAMMTQQATINPEVPGWGLGLQLDKVNGLKVAEHGGDIAGFSALFAVLPEEGVGFYIVNHGEGKNLRFTVKQALLDALYPSPVPSVPKPDATKAAALQEYAGSYISTLACHTCSRSEDDFFQLTVAPDGTLSLWGQTWVPLRGDVFIRSDGKRLLGFARDAHGTVISVSGGSWRVADKIDRNGKD